MPALDEAAAWGGRLAARALSLTGAPPLSVLIFHRVLPAADPLFPGELDAARFDRLMAMVVHVGGETEGDAVIQSRRAGTFGVLPAEVATPLAMALTEVLQNAVEHGFRGRGGVLQITASRQAGRLRAA